MNAEEEVAPLRVLATRLREKSGSGKALPHPVTEVQPYGLQRRSTITKRRDGIKNTTRNKNYN